MDKLKRTPYKYKRITQRNKNTGEVRYFYYENIIKDGKRTTGKRISPKEFYRERGAKERKALSLSEAIEFLQDQSVPYSTIQAVKNMYLGDEERGIAPRTVTQAGLDSIVQNRKLTRTENFVRQLGFSISEFSETFGYSEEYVKEKGFETLGDGVYALKGTDLTFIWDYDRGMVPR